MTESDARGYQRNPNDCSSSIDTEARSNTVSTDAIDADDLYQALSNSRRRQVIRALEDGPCDIDALSRAIAAVENDTTVDAVDSQQRKRVYIGLYQTHFPKLDRWDIIDWDDTSPTVAPGAAHEPALDAIHAVAASDSEPEPEPEPSLLDRIASGLREVVA